RAVDFRINARQPSFFVIGTIDDADAAALRQRNHAAPQKIVIEFVGRRLLELIDHATLRIDALEYALDGAVLARCVHALKDQQQRPAILRVESFLAIAQALAVRFENLYALVR